MNSLRRSIDTGITRSARACQVCGRLAVLLVLALQLSGCGFSLRGSAAISDTLPTLALNLQQPNGEIARQLRSALDGANVAIITPASSELPDDVPVLSVSAERFNVQPVTLTPRARAAQYDVRAALTVGLTVGEQTLFGPEELSLQQIYYEDTDTLTGNREEVEVIQTELRAELVDRILRRLEAVPPVAVAR